MEEIPPPMQFTPSDVPDPPSTAHSCRRLQNQPPCPPQTQPVHARRLRRPQLHTDTDTACARTQAATHMLKPWAWPRVPSTSRACTAAAGATSATASMPVRGAAVRRRRHSRNSSITDAMGISGFSMISASRMRWPGASDACLVVAGEEEERARTRVGRGIGMRIGRGECWRVCVSSWKRQCYCRISHVNCVLCALCVCDIMSCDLKERKVVFVLTRVYTAMA